MTDSEWYLRQMGICPPEKLQFPITVIGAGAVGSATVLVLAKMGCGNIAVWDDDVLEPHNVSNQVCKPSMVGRPKVEALQALISELTRVGIRVRQQRYRGQHLTGQVIASVDNMETRIKTWSRVKLDTGVPLLVDPRVGGELARLYAVRPTDPDHIERYEATLYDSTEAEHLPCGARMIAYCSMIVAGLTAAQIARFARGQATTFELLIDAGSAALLASSGSALTEAAPGLLA